MGYAECLPDNFAQAMTMTNAERQLRYRRRKLSPDGDAVRIDMRVSVMAAAKRERLAKSTRPGMPIERLPVYGCRWPFMADPPQSTCKTVAHTRRAVNRMRA